MAKYTLDKVGSWDLEEWFTVLLCTAVLVVVLDIAYVITMLAVKWIASVKF